MRTSNDVEAALIRLIDENDGEAMDDLVAVATYEDAGILTRDRGLVLRFGSGLEVQLTIVRSANAREEADE